MTKMSIMVAVAAGALAVSGCSVLSPAPAPPAAPAPAGGGLTATSSAGVTLLTVGGDRVELHHRGDATVSRSGKGWSIPEAAKISADSDSVKLKDAAGATTWKVKLGDKVKVLRGEDAVVCEISSPEGGRFKAKAASGAELGTARSDGGGARLQEGTDTTIGTASAPATTSLAALFCTDVPAGPRAVVIGELVARGR